MKKKRTAASPAAARSAEAWKLELEAILRQIPGYNPWDQADDCWLDHAAALKAINWFAEKLRHVEGSTRGEPFILRTWQAAIVGNIFGWKRKDDAGRIVRRYRKAFIEIPRGNGKTPLSAGIVLYGFFEDNEPGAQCFLAAGQRTQAGILFRNAAGMIDQEPSLAERVKIYRGDQHRSIVLNDEVCPSFCKVIPADAAGQHGGIPHITVVDELHVQEDRDLLDVFETAMSKKVRSQPLLVMITTKDWDRVSICNEVEKYAETVRDNGGKRDRPGFDPTFLPVIYDLPVDANIEDESTWSRANPNLDISVQRDALRRTVRKALETPALLNAVKRLHFNIKTSQDVALIALSQWDACCDPTLKIEDFAGKPCLGGLDLSSNEDLTSFYLVFPEPDDSVTVFGWSFCPAEKIRQRARKLKAPYDVWARQGHIIETPGEIIDYSMVREKILWADKLFQIHFIYADPWNAVETGTILREQHGFESRWVVLPQTMMNLSSPTKDLLSRVKSGRIRHDGNPVLRWAAGNLAGYFKGRVPEGESLTDYLDKVPIMPSKQSSADKIDPIAAIINALAAKQGNSISGSDDLSAAIARRGLMRV